MIRIAVVEDEDTYAEVLLDYIRRFADETKEPLAAERFCDGMSFLEDYRGAFDIVLLDIAMPHMNGLEAARRLRAVDAAVCLIFITTLAKYAIRGYEVNALDFVVKPVEYDLFRIKLQKALAFCRRNREETYDILTATEMRRVRFADIRFVESEKHYLLFHTKKEVLRARGSMRDIAELFGKNGFAPIRNSILVNLAYVEGFRAGEVTVGGEVLPVAHSCKAEFLQALASIPLTATGKPDKQAVRAFFAGDGR